MDYTELLAINKWLQKNPGVFVARDISTCWASAHAASGVKCEPKTFKTQCRRAGVDVRKHGDGYLIDFTDGRALLELDAEFGS